jgi:hypothetical protein
MNKTICKPCKPAPSPTPHSPLLIPHSSFLIFIFSLFFSLSAFAQNEQEDFWVCPGFETAVYNPKGMSYGTGLSIAYGDGVSLGARAVYYINGEKAEDVLELTFLVRLYFLELSKGGTNKGPWLQFDGGPALFIRGSILNNSHEWGTISAGLSFGWRFLLGKYFLVEPYVKGGYPFLFGGGASIGFRYGGKKKEE